MGYIFVTREQVWNGLNVIDGLTELTVITGLTATLSFYLFIRSSVRLFALSSIRSRLLFGLHGLHGL